MLTRALTLLERIARTARLEARRRQVRAQQTDRPNDPSEWENVYRGEFQPITQLTSPVAKAVADLTSPGDLLLEAGCGSGAISAELACAGRAIHLCDFSRRILDDAAELFRLSNLPLHGTTLADLTKPLPWDARAVDAVWSSGVLEHWTDSELAPIVAEMARISRKMVISLVPFAGSVFYRLGKHLAEAERLWPYGRELPRATLRPLFEQAGLHSVREWTVWPEAAPNVLSLTDPNLVRTIRSWWDTLPDEDPAKANQGYLLVTVGYRSPQPATPDRTA